MIGIDLVSDIAEAFESPAGARVVSLMGPNGAGKSKLLAKVRDHLHGKKIPCLLLPPNRQIRELNAGLQQRRVERAPAQSDPEKQWGTLVDGLFKKTPPKDDAENTITFASALTTLLWQLAIAQSEQAEKFLTERADFLEGRSSVEPPLPTSIPPLHALRNKIQDILKYPTEIKREFNAQNPGREAERLSIIFSRDGARFTPNELSDGEKQILLLSMFLIGTKVERLVFLVDEPELYLNEALAIEIWQRMERGFPASIFVYATHNPSFATRSGVDKPYVMRRDGSLDRLDSNLPTPHHVLRDIVDTRVQLLRTNAHPIFCEDALGQAIIDDLFAADGVVTIPVHNRNSVVNAVRREEGWQLLRSEGSKYCGIIDRDTADDEEVEKLAKLGVFCFPRYEAESLLLDPKFATWAIGLAGPRFSQEQYALLLVECAKVRRDLMLHRISVHVSHHQRYEPLRFKAKPEAVDSVTINTSSALVTKFEQRAATIYAAIKDQDVDAILTLFKGKCLYSTMQNRLQKERKFDLPEPQQWYLQMRASKGFEGTLAQIGWLSSLRSEVKEFLAA